MKWFYKQRQALKAVFKHITIARLIDDFWELVSYGTDVAGGLRVQLIPWAPASGAVFTDGTFCNSQMIFLVLLSSSAAELSQWEHRAKNCDL